MPGAGGGPDALFVTIVENMASKAAVDFSKVLASGLGKQTASELVAFRKRSEEAKRLVTQLKAQPTTVDFAHYKKLLKVCIGCAHVARMNRGDASKRALLTHSLEPGRGRHG